MWRNSPQLLDTTVDLAGLSSKIFGKEAESDSEALLEMGQILGNLSEKEAVRQRRNIDQHRTAKREEFEWLLSQVQGKTVVTWRELRSVNVRERSSAIDETVLFIVDAVAKAFMANLSRGDPLRRVILDETAAQETALPMGEDPEIINALEEKGLDGEALQALAAHMQEMEEDQSPEEMMTAYVADELDAEWAGDAGGAA